MGGRGSISGTRNRRGENPEIMRRLEEIREQSEQRRIAEEARRERQLGSRTPSLTQGQNFSNVSHDRAANELYNAPVGTRIEMSNHNTGDYVGEYTRTANGWEGSQRYRTKRVKPANVTTSNGFAMQVSGNDVRVLEVGRQRRRRNG